MSDIEDVSPEDDEVRHDTAYSPSSERETGSRQQEGNRSAATEDDEIDEDAVKVLPGTGGPDDPGDVDVDEDDINLPLG